MITKAKLDLIFPSATESDKDKYYPFIEKYLQELNINTCKRINHFFSQVEGEVLQFYYNEENVGSYVTSKNKIINSVFCTNTTSNTYRKYACNHPDEFVGKPHKFANYVYGTMLGNSAPIDGDDTEGLGDGWRYRGRGAHQLTGKSNYTNFNNAIPTYIKDRVINVIDAPDLVADDPELYILSAIWHWNSHDGNATADINNCSECKCAKVCPDTDCVGEVTRKVNGGCNGVKARKDSYDRISKDNKCRK